jgi:RNA 2',3'-cyclic 3'-phosphodiesterase
VTRRIFLGIPAPPEIHAYLEILREQNKNIPEIKWMKDHNLHLTIYFVGNIDGNDFDRIINVLTPIINSTDKIIFIFDKIVFAPSERPKMIWAKFQLNDTFTKLSESIHKTLRSFLPPTKFHYKEPIPHITLARFHPFKQLENIHFPSFGTELIIPLSAIRVYESIDTPNGVRYDDLGSFFYLRK